MDEEFQIISVNSFIINLPVLAVTEIISSYNAESIFLGEELDTKKKQDKTVEVVYFIKCFVFYLILIFILLSVCFYKKKTLTSMETYHLMKLNSIFIWSKI